MLRFELANASADAFAVDEYTGGVFATGRSPHTLDREESPVVYLRVIVRDFSGNFDRAGEAVVRVHLIDINDHAPKFVDLPYHAIFCVKETLPQQLDRKPADAHGLESPSHVLSKLRQACQSNYFKASWLKRLNQAYLFTCIIDLGSFLTNLFVFKGYY